MATDNKIKELLEKFKQDELSASEAKELTKIAKEGDSNDNIKNILTEYWLQPVSGNIQIPAEALFRKIQKNIPETKQTKRYINFVDRITPLIKYAAVVVVSVGLTLLARSIFTENNTNSQLANQAENSIITVSYGSKSKIVLPDGTNVSLNSGSTLKYPAKFSKISRNVYVEGEAYFDVVKDKNHPFYVKTKDITVKVLGTKFNVKAYTDENTIQTTLVCGSIEIYSNKKEITPKNRIIELYPDQQVTLLADETGDLNVINDKEKGKSRTSELALRPIKLKEKIDVAPVIAWKDNRLVFRDDNFVDLARKLERWYDVKIEIDNNELKSVLFSGIFVNETIEQALDALKIATPFKYKMKKNHILITK